MVLPHALMGAGQSVIAVSAHTPSHWPSQQNGSTLQTLKQQVPSAQLGVGCAWKQLPARGSPQASQTSLALMAQLASHFTWQQYA